VHAAAWTLASARDAGERAAFRAAGSARDDGGWAARARDRASDRGCAGWGVGVVDTGGRVGGAGAHGDVLRGAEQDARKTSAAGWSSSWIASGSRAHRIADDRFTAWVAAAHGEPRAVGVKNKEMEKKVKKNKRKKKRNKRKKIKKKQKKEGWKRKNEAGARVVGGSGQRGAGGWGWDGEIRGWAVGRFGEGGCMRTGEDRGGGERAARGVGRVPGAAAAVAHWRSTPEVQHMLERWW